MADYNINANITANTKGYEAGINKVQKTTKSFSASLSKVIQGLGKNGLVGAMGSIGLASAGLTATFGAVVKIAKNVAKAIDECTEAYKKQNIAEIALKTAMDNNPLTNGKSTKQLREFASEMQRTSNMGDEEIIPFMTQLIASGRTEAETMKIIKTASDMASSGAMTFDTAVTQLNATLNGSIGRLGQQNAELKGLTEEELKNGKAVDILAEKYKGLSEATIDTKKQLENAIGDLKESFGSVFEKAFSPMRSFFAEIIQGWADARKAKQEYEGAVQAVASGNADIEQLQIVIDANEKKLEDFNKVVEQKAQEYQKTREEILQNWKLYLNSAEVVRYSEGDLFGPKQAEEIERQNYLLNGRIRLMNKINEAEEKAKQKRAEGEEAEAKRLERDKKANELKEEYLKKIAEQEARWRHIEEVTGESVSNEEKMKFYQDALVDLMTKSGGLITTDNELYKEQMEIIKALATVEQKGKADVASWEDKIIAQEIQRLDMMKEIELEGEENPLKRYEIEKKYADLSLELQLEQLEREKENALKSVEGTENAEEARKKILQYYGGQERIIRVQNAKTISKINDDTEKDTKSTWEKILSIVKGVSKKMASNITQIVGSALKGIGKMAMKFLKNLPAMIKGIFSGLKNISSKLFSFDIDSALDQLLKYEDSVLTFFVETLPQLPAFVDSALQSIWVLIETLNENVKAENIATIIFDGLQKLDDDLPRITNDINTMLQNATEFMRTNFAQIVYEFMSTIGENIPSVISNLAELLVTTIQEGVRGLIQWLDNGGLDEIFKLALDLQKKLEGLVVDLLDQIAGFLEGHTDDIGQFLADSLESAFNTLPDLIDKILRIITALINAIAECFKDEKMINAMIDSMVEGIEMVLKNLGPLVSAVIKLIFAIITALVPRIPEIILRIIGAVAEALPSLVGDIAKALGDAFKQIFEKIFSKDFWEGLLNSFVDAVKSLVKSVGEVFDVSAATGEKKSTAEKAGDVALGVLTGGVGNLVKGLGKKAGWWATGTNAVPSGLSIVGEAGPELIDFRGGERILNNRNTNKALANMGGKTNNFSVTFNNLTDTTAYAMMSQLKQYNRQMAINGVI